MITTKSVITERREAIGMSREWLAILTGVTADTVKRWERNGIAHVHLSMIVKIADALSMSIDELIHSI